jgi:hypothetical protein
MKGVSRMETDNNRLHRAISKAIEDACETLGARCEFTPEELREGQGWADHAESEDSQDDDVPPTPGCSARCYAMMILRFSRRTEAFLAAPTLTAKLAVLGVQVDDPQPFADPVAVLESSARGHFASSQARLQ